jgi:hypothetical protein
MLTQNAHRWRGNRSRIALLAVKGAAVRFRTLCPLLLLIALCPAVSAQGKTGWPHPPLPADTSITSVKPANSVSPLRLDPVQLQREARELLELSQALQPDIEYVNRGLLPKDTIEKLKRIEKLSKRLRGQLSP